MSEIEKFKKNENNSDTNFKNKNNEIGNKSHRNTNNLVINKNIKILNIDKLLSKNNFSFSRNRKKIQKNLLPEDFISQTINGKKNNGNDSKNHKKNLTNIYDSETFPIKPEMFLDFKKLTEKKIFHNKMHRRIQTERQNIELIRKINKSGNRYVLVNTRNAKKNNGFTTEFLFEGKNDKVNIYNILQNSTLNVNLTINKSFQKKYYMKKLNPLLIINNENKTKNNTNNFCLKSCNLENNKNILRKRKIYTIKTRNKNNDNIFKTQTKLKNNCNFYSQENSISYIKSTNLKKKMNYLLKFPKKKIYLSSNLGQSFELPKKNIFFSNSNINIQSYTSSFDDGIKNKLINDNKKIFKNNNFTTIQKKYTDTLTEKHFKKKPSNYNLKNFPYKIENLFKDNSLHNSNITFIKDNKLNKNRNSRSTSKSTEHKQSLESKYIYSKNQNTIKQFKNEKNNTKTKEKDKKFNKKSIITDLDTLPLKESIKIKNPLINLQLKLNNDSNKIKELLKKKKLLKLPKNNLIKPKILPFQSKKIIKMESLSKKGFWQPGKEKENQDNYFILNNINGNPNFYYMGVCDGHGIYGKDVSYFLINNLPQKLNKNIINNKIKYLSFESINNLSKIIVNSFIQTNNELINNPNINTYLSGSTCVSILFTPRRLISINVGDSRCILGKFNGEKWYTKNLSRDHKPIEEDEKKRIITNGGRVEQNKDEFGNCRGPLRIWLKDEEIPGLAVSRSFGDELANKIGVICEPEIKEYIFLSEDKFFILASDGLWEYISSEECVNIIKDYYLKNDIEGAINHLYKESSKRWIMEEDVIDDITLIVVFMN